MKNKKIISKLLLISSTALSIPVISTVVATSSPRLRVPKVIRSGISRLEGIFRPSTSSSRPPRVITNNLKTNAETFSTSSLDQHTPLSGASSNNNYPISQASHLQHNFQGNSYPKVLQSTLDKKIILENRKTEDGTLFQIREGTNGTKHHVQVTSNSTYTETYDSEGRLILRSERGSNGLTTEWFNNGEVIKRQVRDKTGVFTIKFD